MNSKIVKLDVENVKRVSAVHIEPDGSVVVIGGRNGAGKSSVLDSIAYALGGKSLCPTKPIKDGQDKASVKVDLGNLVVERSWTGAHSYLSVKNKEGMLAASPQKVLDEMVGQLTFDPLLFATMKPAERETLLREILGLDFTELDEKRNEAFSKRTEVNRQVKELEAQIKAMPAYQDAPAEPISVSGLMVELRKREAINTEHKEEENALEDLRTQERTLSGEIKDLETRLAKLKDEYRAIVERGKKQAAKVEKLVYADTDEVRQQIEEADEVNNRVRANQKNRELITQAEKVKAESASLTNRIKAIDDEKHRAITKAKPPIGGLALGEDGVTLNGIPFDQISQAEKLRASVAMGLKMNPKLRVMLIRDGSLLDQDNLQLVQKMAEENDAQIWIERVGDGPEVSVLIEDGTTHEEVLV